LSAEPNVVEGERAEAELGDKDSAGFVKAMDNGGVLRGDAVAKWFGAVSGWNSRGVEKIFAAPGDAVKRSGIFRRRFPRLLFLLVLERGRG
jgi:hypothetical protein